MARSARKKARETGALPRLSRTAECQEGGFPEPSPPPAGAPPPKGEARLGFAQAFGGAPTWLPLRGPLRPGGTLPSGRPRRQPRRWHGAAVTERANPKLSQGRRKEEGQVRGKTQVLCGVALIRPQGQVSSEKGRRHLLTRPLGQVSRSRIFPSFFPYLTLGY